jgi:hypothetical protein
MTDSNHVETRSGVEQVALRTHAASDADVDRDRDGCRKRVDAFAAPTVRDCEIAGNERRAGGEALRHRPCRLLLNEPVVVQHARDPAECRGGWRAASRGEPV